MVNNNKNLDYQLYLVTDSQLISTHTLAEAVTQAILGGVTMIQLREKTANSADFYAQALVIKAICQNYHIPLIINDRIDIALAVDADGVHIGQTDLPANIARQLIGHDKILGVSAKTVTQAIQAEKDGADYLGVGAIFNTQTKQDTCIVSMKTLEEIYNTTSMPIVAIGGINHLNLPQFMFHCQQSNIHLAGIAVVSAILTQKNIQHASKQLKQIFLSH